MLSSLLQASSLWSGLSGDQRWNETLCSLSRICQSGRSVLVTHTNMFKHKIRVYWVPLGHGVWALQHGSPVARGSGRSGQRAPGQGWAPSPLTRASFAAIERFCVSQPSFHFYTLWSSCCWKGLSPSREHTQEGILWNSERESPIVPLPWPKKEKPWWQLFFLTKGLNIECLFLATYFTLLGEPRSLSSCWDFYFLKKKTEHEVEEGKGDKTGEGELWEKTGVWGKLENPHWAPVSRGCPIWAATSQHLSSPK